VDERRRHLYITARGREPTRFLYHAYLYRVGFDGTGVELLTPEDGDHEISFAPSGRYFVDTYSRVDQPPITVLRRARDGRVLRTLERADVSRLARVHWTPPTLIHMTAADGRTDIYGLMYTPSDFDSTRKYPLINRIYPEPGGSVRKWGFNLGDYQYPRALAELGFVVVEITGRGTQGRSKAFLDPYYGHIGTSTLPDQVAAIRQLARRYAFIDSTRVGIYGFSGGGFAAAAAMLRYPELFKVGVSASGNHDNRSYAAFWGEKFQGLYRRDSVTGSDNYAAEANYTLASKLRGKLLLMHGDMDENTHPGMTLRLVHSLIAANKSFDFLLFPDRGHTFVLDDPYAVRMTCDYFVRNLLGVTPPDNYAFRSPVNQ
jgi:dipeptidyl aminopeptidase/acylaminoacyl peptidase